MKANKVCRVEPSPLAAAFAMLTPPITHLQTPHLQAFSDKLVEIVSMDDDYVWIHDYHLMVCCLQPLALHTAINVVHEFSFGSHEGQATNIRVLTSGATVIASKAL